MRTVLVPTTDVNSPTAVVNVWYAQDRSHVAEGEVIAEAETSKAIVDVTAPAAGYLLRVAAVGEQISLDRPLALIFDELTALEGHEKAAAANGQKHPGESGPRASVPARRRAEALGVDLRALDVDGLITVRDVEEAAAARRRDGLPDPLGAGPRVERMLLIGAGQGANQVMEILAAGGGEQRAVGIIDDDARRWGTAVEDVPVVGGADRLGALFAAGAFDSAIVAISTSIPARRRFRELCLRLDVPLANAIDPTARIGRDVALGRGNVICAFCHVGPGSRVGDNNFVSAYNSFDHHNVLGSEISTGPGCMTSGDVRIGDRVRLGTGIFVQPHVVLGDDASVASGAVLVSSVPPGHAVKTRVTTTAVVPPWRSRA